MQESYFRFIGCRIHTLAKGDYSDLFGCDRMRGSYLDEYFGLFEHLNIAMDKYFNNYKKHSIGGFKWTSKT